MIFKIFTLFPGFFDSPLKSGLLGKALDKGIIDISIIDIKEYSLTKFRQCDDYPYGGGSGMVLQPGPLLHAVEENITGTGKVIFPTPSGKPFSQKMVKQFSSFKEICIICGHYEGIDQRVIDSCVDYEISIGDYVLSGGEFAGLVIVDSIARYVPGFMSNSESLVDESFENDLLEYPHYTRPEVFKDMKVPGILLSGNHGKIKEWRYNQSLQKTQENRLDLYKKFLARKILGE